jgi:ribosomal protein L11 methyltransferase
VEHIPFQNWNEKWESEFEPIYINNFCCVRAPFHDTPAQVKHDIIIEPKMAFGTGHHATTYLMIKTMKDLNIDNKRVLDYGTGTGILAILAEQMHAEDVIAIDNDLSAYENTLENIEKNNCTKISVQHAVLSELKADVHFDHILANINRNVLLESVEEISRNANLHAQLLLSGFYKDDLPLIKKAYSNEWVLEHSQSKENWCCAKFKKKYP